MGCCAVATCSDPACAVCTVSQRFPPVQACGRNVDGDPCALVKGHPSWVRCRTRKGAKAEKATRDGDPKLAGERTRGNLAFRKRQRAGPNWIPHDRRV
jgi:hypothetical protein